MTLSTGPDLRPSALPTPFLFQSIFFLYLVLAHIAFVVGTGPHIVLWDGLNSGKFSCLSLMNGTISAMNHSARLPYRVFFLIYYVCMMCACGHVYERVNEHRWHKSRRWKRKSREWDRTSSGGWDGGVRINQNQYVRNVIRNLLHCMLILNIN